MPTIADTRLRNATTAFVSLSRGGGGGYSWVGWMDARSSVVYRKIICVPLANKEQSHIHLASLPSAQVGRDEMHKVKKDIVDCRSSISHALRSLWSP